VKTDPAIWDDPARLETWTLHQLEELDFGHDFVNADWYDWQQKYLASMPRDPLAAAVASAEHGNIDPIRKLLPRIAKFLHLPPPPPRRRGPKRKNPRGWTWAIDEARDDVQRVRALWREHFGRVYRSESPRATEIAAARHDLKEEQLLSDRKTRYRRLRRR
jgi:hypothetical protein